MSWTQSQRGWAKSRLTQGSPPVRLLTNRAAGRGREYVARDSHMSRMCGKEMVRKRICLWMLQTTDLDAEINHKPVIASFAFSRIYFAPISFDKLKFEIFQNPTRSNELWITFLKSRWLINQLVNLGHFGGCCTTGHNERIYCWYDDTKRIVRLLGKIPASSPYLLMTRLFQVQFSNNFLCIIVNHLRRGRLAW